MNRNLLRHRVRLWCAPFIFALRFEFGDWRGRGRRSLRIDCPAKSNRVAGQKRALVFLAEASIVEGFARGLPKRRH
jgi:hypothetical protein